MDTLPTHVLVYLAENCSFRESIALFTINRKYKAILPTLKIDVSPKTLTPAQLNKDFLQRYYITGLKIKFFISIQPQYLLPIHNERITSLCLESNSTMIKINMDILAQCTNLRWLRISPIFMLTNYNFVTTLTHLTSLDIGNYYSCKSLLRLDQCSNLTSLTITHEIFPTSLAHGIENLHFIEPTLTRLTLRKFSNTLSMTKVAVCSNLVSLTLSDCSKIVNMNALCVLKELRHLNLSDNSVISTLQFLSNFSYLTTLDLSLCKRLMYLTGVEKFTQLQKLNIMICDNLLNLRALRKCTQIKEISAMYATKLTTLEGLEECLQLEYLHLGRCTNLITIESLREHTKLKALNLSECRNITSFAVLGTCINLEYLSSADCGLRFIDFLATCTKLRCLCIHTNNITNVDSLVVCSELIHLEVDSTINTAALAVIQNLQLIGPNERLWNM